ncbi:hypothetical protein ACT8ZS_35020 [Paenibacillus sp. M.A.Huq-84]
MDTTNNPRPYRRAAFQGAAPYIEGWGFIRLRAKNGSMLSSAFGAIFPKPQQYYGNILAPA